MATDIDIIGGDLLAQMTGGVFEMEPSYTSESSDSPAAILATYLMQQLIMTSPSASSTWPLYIASLPDGANVQDNAGAIYNTTPVKDSRQMSDGFVLKHYGIQIKIRAKDDETGWDKCNDILSLFDAVHNVDVTKGDVLHRLQNISQTSGIVSLGTEIGTKRRLLFTMNFLVTLKEV